MARYDFMRSEMKFPYPRKDLWGLTVMEEYFGEERLKFPSPFVD